MLFDGQPKMFQPIHARFTHCLSEFMAVQILRFREKLFIARKTVWLLFQRGFPMK